MNTLLFTLEYPPFRGGIANYYGNLVKYWPANDSAGKPNNIFVLDNSAGKLINKFFPTLGWLPAILKLKKAVKTDKIDHIVVGQILPLGTAALINSVFSRIEYSVILHGLDFSCAAKTGRKKMLAKIILMRAQKIICANSYTAELIKSFLGNKYSSRIKIINPGAESPATLNARLAGELKLKHNLDNKIILLSVGRLIKRKGFDMVIEAMPGVLAEVPDLAYVILGDGEERNNLKSKIINLKLRNNAIIINSAADDERDAWYHLCDIFIMPSRNINGDFEGFGIVYLEANLAGKPVIAGRDGGVGDAVIENLNGLLADSKNSHSIADAIIKLARDSDLRKMLGERGRERAIKDFSWPKQAEKIYNLIQTK